MQQKDVLQSKTFYGIAILADPGVIRTVILPFITAMIVMLNGLGFNLGDPAEYNKQLDAVLTGMQTVIGAALALWGLVTRKTAIGSVAGVKVRS